MLFANKAEKNTHKQGIMLGKCFVLEDNKISAIQGYFKNDTIIVNTLLSIQENTMYKKVKEKNCNLNFSKDLYRSNHICFREKLASPIMTGQL